MKLLTNTTVRPPRPSCSSSGSGSASDTQDSSRPVRRRGAVIDRRTTWERLSQIDELIASGTYPSRRMMARRLGVTERTVTRDIDFMITKRHLPIEYDQRRYGYYYSKPVHGFPK